MFQNEYAQYYDLFYKNKNYFQEFEYIHNAFQLYFKEGKMNRIIDFGCGTGEHSIHLAKNNYKVVGVDLSTNMIAHANLKANRVLSSNRPEFNVGDIRNIKFSKPFDGAIMMFAVLGYFNLDEDVILALSNIRKNLKPGAILVFDYWNGLNVLSEMPKSTFKEFYSDDINILRLSKPTNDLKGNICNLEIRTIGLDGDRIVFDNLEEHHVRYFMPNEILRFLDICGFELLEMNQFPKLSSSITNDSWYGSCVARAV